MTAVTNHVTFRILHRHQRLASNKNTQLTLRVMSLQCSQISFCNQLVAAVWMKSSTSVSKTIWHNRLGWFLVSSEILIKTSYFWSVSGVRNFEMLISGFQKYFDMKLFPSIKSFNKNWKLFNQISLNLFAEEPLYDNNCSWHLKIVSQ